jgi:hypothetical protein
MTEVGKNFLWEWERNCFSGKGNENRKVALTRLTYNINIITSTTHNKSAYVVSNTVER